MHNPRSPLDDYRFHIDTISEKHISGWALKTSEEHHHPMIEVRSGETVLWRTAANIYRDDLLAAGVGTGKHAFMLVPKPDLLLAPITSVSLYMDGYLIQADAPLNMSPALAQSDMVVQKSNPTEITPVVDAPAGESNYRVHLDHSDLDVVRGWVFKDGHIHHRSKVEARCGDVVLASGLAEQFREDLLAADIGDGAYGFSLAPNVSSLSGSVCECCLFVDGKATNVNFVLEVGHEPTEKPAHNDILTAEVTEFTKAVDAKIALLQEDVLNVNRDAGQDDFAVKGQLNVIMRNIAELSVRMKAIEHVLVKQLSEK